LSGTTNEHLPARTLAELYDEACRPGHPRPKAAEVHPHLATCSLCQERFEAQSILDRQLEQIRSPKPALRQSDCPDPGLWREIAAGVTPPEQALVNVQHASRCDHCGILLREAVSDLNGENTLSDEERIASLESASPEWQRKLAQRITGRAIPTPVPWWSEWLAIPRLATVGATILVVVAVGWWGAVQQRQPQNATRLIARAYSDQRTLELRIAGARYAPLRVQRGPAESFVERSTDLLKAESIIASQLPAHPSDPAWLQAKAQADLLEGKYDAAVESLKRALELAPNTSDFLIDLSTAYFQRARQEDRPEDYGAAYEHLSQVLARQPDNAVALYNRAIVAEQQFLYHQALEDWEHFLKVDPRSEWAEEARSRAEAVRAKLKAHENRATLLTPEQIASRLNDAGLTSEIDARVEEYLHEAVRTWLQQAYPQRGSGARMARDVSRETKAGTPVLVPAAADPRAVRALFFLADLTAREHDDRWLADLLAGSSAPGFPTAVGALALALQANDAGDYDVSHIQSALAEQRFRAAGNTAGVLRGQFERVFSAQMSRRSEECRHDATAALTVSQNYAYPWLQIQFGLERGLCSSLMSDLGTDERSVQRALDLAEQARFLALYLRALGFLAEDKFDTGDSSQGCRLIDTGLQRYWSGDVPGMRAYSLYSHLAYGIDPADQPRLQVAVWREAETLIDSDEDLLLRAIAHRNWANAAVIARQPHLAESQYAEAARLFALAPRTAASRSDAIESEIRTAQLEARQHRFDAAVARLIGVQGEVRQLNNYLAQMFYATLGDLQLRRHNAVEAEQALRPALVLAEQSLASLNSVSERENWRDDAAPIYLAMAEAELVQGRVEESLDVFEWYLGASQREGAVAKTNRPGDARLYGNQPDGSWLASRLPLLSNETVLAFGVLPDGVAIWVYDNRGVSAHWIPEPPHDLEETATRLYELSSDPRSPLSALRRDARTLYSTLIAPVEQRLESGRTLVIETEGWPSQVPFEALLDSGGRYLIERSPIVYSRGQYSDVMMRGGAPFSPNLPALVVGSEASSQVEELRPIPGIASEADAVASEFQHPRVLKGRDATLAAVRNELPKAAVFHFAGHSLATANRSGLMLEGEDRAKKPALLEAQMLQPLRLQAMQLAVLSACTTGHGASGSRGFSSITDALLRAGVPHVVASRWAVDSETRSFSEDFYGNLLAGQPVASAIQLTSRRMLSNPRTVHPYYWSAFAAYGRP